MSIEFLIPLDHPSPEMEALRLAREQDKGWKFEVLLPVRTTGTHYVVRVRKVTNPAAYPS